MIFIMIVKVFAIAQNDSQWRTSVKVRMRSLHLIPLICLICE